MSEQWVATRFGGPEALELRTVELPPPQTGEVTIEVRAAGMNPVDYKHLRAGGDPSVLPLPIGEEVAGVISAIGPDTPIATGSGSVGDAVIGFRVRGGYSSALTTRADNFFAKPDSLDYPQAANLMLAGTTASEMLHVTGVQQGDTVLLHGAAGAVGVSVLQQARLLGITVIGTADAANFDAVRGYGGIPVPYGPGLEGRVRKLAPEGIKAAFDAVGTTEAIDVSEALVADRRRIVTIAAHDRAQSDGLIWIMASIPASNEYRNSQRIHLLQLTAPGKLEVPVGATYPFERAREAVEALMGRHPYGKLALIV